MVAVAIEATQGDAQDCCLACFFVESGLCDGGRCAAKQDNFFQLGTLAEGVVVDAGDGRGQYGSGEV